MQNMSSRDNVNKIFTKYNSSSLQTCPSNHLTSLKGDIKYFIDMRGCEKQVQISNAILLMIRVDQRNKTF